MYTEACRCWSGFISKYGQHSHLSLVEDSDRQVMPVTILWPLPEPAINYSSQVVRSLYPVGTCLAIKEPYVRYGAKGMPEILIGWPKDVHELPLTPAFSKVYNLEVSRLSAETLSEPSYSAYGKPCTPRLESYRLAAASAFKQNKVEVRARSL